MCIRDSAKALGASQFLNDDDRFLFYPIGEDAQVLELEEDDMYFLLYTICLLYTSLFLT